MDKLDGIEWMMSPFPTVIVCIKERGERDSCVLVFVFFFFWLERVCFKKIARKDHKRGTIAHSLCSLAFSSKTTRREKKRQGGKEGREGGREG